MHYNQQIVSDLDVANINPSSSMLNIVGRCRYSTYAGIENKIKSPTSEPLGLEFDARYVNICTIHHVNALAVPGSANCRPY
jgi:hypothetical protein